MVCLEEKDFKDINDIWSFLLNLDKLFDGNFYESFENEINNIDFINYMYQKNKWNKRLLDVVEKDEYKINYDSIINILSDYFKNIDDDDVELNYEIIYLVSFYLNEHRTILTKIINNISNFIKPEEIFIYFEFNKKFIPDWLINSNFLY